MWQIRLAGSQDAQAMLDLRSNTIMKVNARDYSPEQIQVWVRKATSEDFTGAFERGEYFVCASDDGRLLGQGQLEGDRIEGVFVAADMIGQGIGSAILDRLEQEARKRGIKALHLNSTTTALGFYEHKGYTQIERTQVKAGGVALDVVKMRKDSC